MPKGFANWSELAKSQYLEAAIFMSGYLLSSQGDRMAMGNSVEGRYPFLDYRVIEFCNKLPDNQKLNCLNEKFILKKLSMGKIPPSITTRPKQPYRAPIASILSNQETPNYINEILSEESLNSFGIFNSAKVGNLIKSVKQQKMVSEIDQMAIAGILSTQLLYKMFIKEPLVADVGVIKNCRIIDDTKVKVIS